METNVWSREDTTKIDRGRIIDANENGYRVASHGRHGLVTLRIRGIDGKTFQLGDKVYFFTFEDGDGLILDRIG